MDRQVGLGVLTALVWAGCARSPEPPCTEFEEIFVWVDADGDGYGSDEPIGYVCAPEANQAPNEADCDDGEPTVHPNSEELCDLLDNDCDGWIDESAPRLPWYEDADGDGYGRDRDPEVACAPPGPTWIGIAGDCDDEDPEVNPSIREICNGIDDDCDRKTDDEDAGVDPTTFVRFHYDRDQDGYGDIEAFVERCEQPPGLILDGRDCDDGRPRVNPAGQEVCNQLDDDCDTLTDDFDPDLDPSGQSNFYTDADGDGYGDPSSQTPACRSTPGVGVDNSRDCDDTDPDASIDQWWYHDNDGDGFGAGQRVVFQCLDPGGDLAPGERGLDCDDFDWFENPGAPEICFDGRDQNCDLAVDCADADCVGTLGCLALCVDEEIRSPLPSRTNGSTVGRGNDTVPGCSLAGTAAEVAFLWVPTATGRYTIDTFGSAYDTTLYVLDSCGGAELACNDDTGGLQSQVQIQGVAGVPVIIVVDGYGASEGSFVLNIQ